MTLRRTASATSTAPAARAVAGGRSRHARRSAHAARSLRGDYISLCDRQIVVSSHKEITMRLLEDLGSVGVLRSEPNLTERVTEMLLSQLTAGQYQPGDVLPPEQTIAEHMGVSRTVLREAVARLKAEGYVVSKQGRGLIVQANRRPAVLKMHAAEAGDFGEAMSIVELRQGFEMVAAALAAERRTPQDLEQMRNAVDRMREAIRSGDVAAGVQADLDFHQAIAAATRNEHYVAMFGFIAELYKKNLRVSREGSKAAGRAADAQGEHERLLQAIEAGDADLARDRASIHVENTGLRLMAHQRQAERAAKTKGRKR